MSETKTEDKVLWVPRIIQVSELRSGNRIVLKTAPARLNSLSEEQRENILAYFWFLNEQPVIVERSKKVETIDECTSLWRTHIHVNKMQCYDTRLPVTIAVPL